MGSTYPATPARKGTVAGREVLPSPNRALRATKLCASPNANCVLSTCFAQRKFCARFAQRKINCMLCPTQTVLLPTGRLSTALIPCLAAYKYNALIPCVAAYILSLYFLTLSTLLYILQHFNGYVFTLYYIVVKVSSIEGMNVLHGSL